MQIFFTIVLVLFGKAASLPISLHPPSGAVDIFPSLGFILFLQGVVQHLGYTISLDSQPCPIWTVSQGLFSWGFFWGFNISNIFGRGSEMVRRTCDHFLAIWIALSSYLLGGISSCIRVAIFLTAIVWRFDKFVCPLVPCFIESPKLLEVPIRACEKFLEKSSTCLLVLSLYDEEGLHGLSFLISNRLNFLAVFPHVLWGDEN